ncbi:Unknown protein [Striga hermonthica]|uniref:Uncharacterized protein n=1 Tax=Striga hermonthica TaxID=68872 RepID=A0A9N7MZW4_STRHE|nr:Unknown protein [Striga hermonthica]
MASGSARKLPARLLYSPCTRYVGPAPPRASAAALLACNFHILSFSAGSGGAARLRKAKEELWKEYLRKGMIVGNDREGDDCVITAHDEEMSDSIGFEDKRKVSPQAPDKENAKRPAITGLLDASLASRFLSDPIITDKCDILAKDEFVVQMAQQLLEALQASTVLEDGTFNDSAFEHFALVMRIWRNDVFNTLIGEMIYEDCVSDIIDKLSNEVENEQIGERMCRIKADHNLSDILQLKKPPATMIRGLLIIVLGYWSYNKLPLMFDEKLMCFDGDCGYEGHKVAEDGYEIIEREIVSDMEIGLASEEHSTRLIKTPIQSLDDELFIVELAHDLKQDSCLFGKTQQCMEFLHIFDPKDDGSLFSAELHYDLAHEVLEDLHFIQLLIESLKMDFEGRRLVKQYGKRAKVKNEDVLATVKNIVKDPGFHQYKDHIEKNEVRAVRVFLSILIVHWVYDDVLKKVNTELCEYDQAIWEATQIASADAWKATGYDDVEAEICYVTRFAGDLKGLTEALGKVYGTRPYKHIFDKFKKLQFYWEINARRNQYDVRLDIDAYSCNGRRPGGSCGVI